MKLYEATNALLSNERYKLTTMYGKQAVVNLNQVDQATQQTSNEGHQPAFTSGVKKKKINK